MKPRPAAGFPTGDRVGYLVFHDHIATAESALIDAINQLRGANIQDLVLDLRYNNGGDNTLNRAIVRRIIQSPSIDRHGRLYVLIGRKTFSAAVNLVSDLEQMTNAIFVGEPTAAPAT